MKAFHPSFPLFGNGGHVSGGNVWNPAALPNLVLWFDGQDISTITATSNRVSAWQSKGAYTGAANQSTGAQQPLYEPTGLNDRSCIYFDGATTGRALLTGASVQATTYSTIYVVYSCVSVPTIPGVYLRTTLSGPYLAFENIKTDYQRQDNTNVGMKTEAGSPVGRTAIDCVLIDSTQTGFNQVVAAYRSGVALSLTNSTNTATAGPNPVGAWVIGSWNGVGANRTDCRIGEILVYDALHDSATITNATNQLARKWGF